MSLTVDQVARVAYAAGWRGEDLATAIAIAYRESGFDPQAHNAKPPDNSYGLWQLNMLNALGPARRAQWGLSTNEDLFDPATNARAAYALWRQAGWRPWTTYRSNAATAYLPVAREAAKRVEATGGAGGSSTDGPVVTPVGLQSLVDPAAWRRAALTLGVAGLGLGLVVLGGRVAVQPTVRRVRAVENNVAGKVAAVVA